MVLNRKSTTHRLSSLDILRGVAVLLMVEAHINIIIPFFSDVAVNFAAPTFLFVAGVSFQLLLRNRESRGKTIQETFLEIFWRAVTLLLLTSVITVVINLLLGGDSSAFTSVFLVIATGFLVGFLVRDSFKQQILAILIILVLNLVIESFQVEALYFLTGSISQDPLTVTVLPYLCFFIFGQMAFKTYKPGNFNQYDNKILLVYAALFFMLNLAFYLAFPYPLLTPGVTYLPELLMSASLLIILLLVLVRVVELDGKLKVWLRPLENLGRISFTSYYLTYLSFLVLGSFQYTQPLVTNVLIFFSTSLGLVLLERVWRPHYRYGLEWWYRRISTRALSFSRTILKN